MQAIYTAGSGLAGQQARLDTIAANVANANTTGYKSVRVDFKDALYALMDSPVSDGEANNLLLGSGLSISAYSASPWILPSAARGSLPSGLRRGRFYTPETGIFQPAGSTAKAVL